IEKRSIDVVPHDVLDSIFRDRAWVYNTQALRVYRRASIEYSADENDAGYTEELFAGEPFFEVDGIDYLFMAPPQTISISSGTKEKKIAFNTDPMSISAYGWIRLREGKLDDAEKAFRIAIAADPCDSD